MYVFSSNKLLGSQESRETSQISDDTVAGRGVKLLMIKDDNEWDVWRQSDFDDIVAGRSVKLLMIKDENE